MIEQTNEHKKLRDLLEELKSEKIIILTKNNLHYRLDKNSKLEVFGDTIKFLDKFGKPVLLPFMEISQVTGY